MNKETVIDEQKKNFKGLSEWQLSRVRNALRAFHRYARGLDGEYFTWKDVREAIVSEADYEIGGAGTKGLRQGAEVLRKFVEGEVKKTSPTGRKFTTPKPDSLNAIVTFLMAEGIDLLSEEELIEHFPGPQTAMRFSEYQLDRCDLEQSIEHVDIEGVYVGSPEEPDGVSEVTLTFQRQLDGFLQVVETQDVYDTSSFEESSNWHYQGGPVEKHTSKSRFFGWAVLTPEDNLILLMKAERNGRNLSYISLNDVGLWKRETKSRGPIFFMRQEFGAELGEQVDDFKGDWRIILSHLRDNILRVYPLPEVLD